MDEAHAIDGHEKAIFDQLERLQKAVEDAPDRDKRAWAGYTQRVVTYAEHVNHWNDAKPKALPSSALPGRLDGKDSFNDTLV